jgi:putative two-component system response regulator
MPSAHRILAVDDDPTNLAIIREALEQEYDLCTASDGESAIRLARDYRPTVILLDVMMPGIDGYEVCRRIRECPLARHIRIIMVSAKTDIVDRMRGYEVGADDYMTKPFIEDELLAKIRVALRTRDLDEVKALQRQLEHMCGNHGEVLALVSQLRDSESGDHLVNIRAISHILAGQLRQSPYENQIDDNYLDNLYIASILHDVGKVGVPDHILHKCGEWTADEWSQMKDHTTIGERVLKRLAELTPKVEAYCMAAAIARWHHECFDGSGYPDGIRGLSIPLAARIVKVADVFDVSMNVHPEKAAERAAEICAEMVKSKSAEFDPVIVDTLVENVDEILDLYTCEHFAETLELTS